MTTNQFDTVSQTDLAAMLKKSVITIRSWTEQGAPCVSRGAKGKQAAYDLAAVIEWLIEKRVAAALGDTSEMSIDEAKRRREAAQASLAELDLAERTGMVAPIEAVAEYVGKEYAVVRSKLMALPGGLASDLADLTPAEIQERLADAIAELLHALTADAEYAKDAANADGT